jgi:hypothetical protein
MSKTFLTQPADKQPAGKEAALDCLNLFRQSKFNITENLEGAPVPAVPRDSQAFSGRLRQIVQKTIP